MIVTPADQPRIVEAILQAHPEKRRLIFVHIPKCAGTDLTTNLGKRYPTIHQTLGIPDWTPPERLQGAVDEIEQKVLEADTILVAGHHRLQWVIRNDLYRPHKDRLFTVVREPHEIILSALNYTIGKLIGDPYGTQPDTRGWLRGLAVADVAGWPAIDLALHTLQSGAILRNALCHSLGQGTAASALDLIRESGIEITETTRYPRWAEATWGFPFTTRHNASKHLVGLEDLPGGAIADRCREDLMLYPQLMQELGHKLSFTSGANPLVDIGSEDKEDEQPTGLGMPPELAEKIGSLPRLSPRARMNSAVSCKICGVPAPFFDAVDFLKCTAGYPFGPSGVLVPYHRCEACGYLFTPFFDTWTKQAFRRFIYNDDYIVIDPEYTGARPARVASRLATVLAPARGSRVLDWGAGSGVFASTLSQSGFDAEAYDPFSAPEPPTGRYRIITCVEAIEHVPDPMRTFERMTEHLAQDGMIIIGETLQPDDIERIRCSWWYAAPRNGHCSLFDRRTFATIADRLGLVFRSHAPGGPHVLHRPSPDVLNEIVQNFGPAISYFRLGAPGVAGERWNGVERPGGRPAFQWTAASELSWGVTVPPGPKRRVIVDLPFEHVIADFVGGCRIQIGASLATIDVRDHMLVGELADVEPGPLQVTLKTPPLMRARGPDNRMIGIALRVCPA
jgi:2-polyprenyl-6-hydroxyphenyl methylase/3-demethylubiquinone-9 3-methyltransferase